VAVTITGRLVGMSNTVYTLVIIIPVILIAISVHETMHALASYWLGDDTAQVAGRISLNPLRHIDPFLTVLLPILLVLAHQPPFGAAKPVMVNFNRVKWGEFGGAVVAAVGPLSNLVMAVAAAAALRAFHPSGAAYDFLGYAVILNIGFFVFNSIPWPPLDGSRVLYAFAPRPLQEFMEGIERWGIMGLILFLLLFYPLLSPLVSNLVQKLAAGLLL